ncbi:MAG: ACP S-malonyltransferase [Endomicrobiales bacterium]|nr:ACP S-malonyltransferase [Endomicrobiales bacterium]
MKIGLIFPGQGSQYIGMAKELSENFQEAKAVLEVANASLGFDISKIMFEGPDDLLKQTRYTQPAIFTASVAAFSVFEKNFNLANHEIIVAGHSLGEYSALAASKVFSLKDGLKLVKARGEFIQNASIKNPGAMAAIMGLEKNKVLEICKNSSSFGVCEAVNFNCPGQIVIAGSKDAIENAVNLASSSGAMKAVVLNVSGPFHSVLMSEAAENMKAELGNYNLSNPLFPVVTNCDAQLTTTAQNIKEKLVLQINHPVLWEDSISLMISAGVNVFVELGPQRILSGLVKRISKAVKLLNVEDLKTLNKTIEELQKLN